MDYKSRGLACSEKCTRGGSCTLECIRQLARFKCETSHGSVFTNRNGKQAKFQDPEKGDVCCSANLNQELCGAVGTAARATGSNVGCSSAGLKCLLTENLSDCNIAADSLCQDSCCGESTCEGDIVRTTESDNCCDETGRCQRGQDGCLEDKADDESGPREVTGCCSGVDKGGNCAEDDCGSCDDAGPKCDDSDCNSCDDVESKCKNSNCNDCDETESKCDESDCNSCDEAESECNDSSSCRDACCGGNDASLKSSSDSAAKICPSTYTDIRTTSVSSRNSSDIDVKVNSVCSLHLNKAFNDYLEFIKMGRCICLELLERVESYSSSISMSRTSSRSTSSCKRKKCCQEMTCLFNRVERKTSKSCCASKIPRTRKESEQCVKSTGMSCCTSKFPGECRQRKTRSRSGLSNTSGGCCGKKSPSVQAKPVASGSIASVKGRRSDADLEAGMGQSVTFKISGMTCTGCSKKVSNVLKEMDGISSARVTFATATVEFDYDPAMCDLNTVTMHLVKKTGFTFSQVKRNQCSLDVVVEGGFAKFDKIEALVESIDQIDKNTYRVGYNPFSIGGRTILAAIPGANLAGMSQDSHVAQQKKQFHSLLWKTCLCALFTIPVLVLAWSNVDVDYRTCSIVQLVLASFVQAIAVPEFYSRALKSLIYSRVIEMDLLVVISITAAYFYSIVAFGLTLAGKRLEVGEFFETSTLLITLVFFGRFLTSVAKYRAVSSISMRALQIPSATIIEDGKNVYVDSRLLQHGDIFLVKPHARIVTDGIVNEGESTVDESMLTGESSPVVKVPHDLVFAGTFNGPSTLIVKLTRLPGDNSIADIADLVDNALAAKPRVQDLADKIAGYFVPVVLAISLVVFVIWIAINMRIRHKDGGSSVGSAITYAIAVMAISCPCALGLAVPMVVVVAGGVAARRGVVIKSLSVLERGYRITDIVFDKTGTLTSDELNCVNEIYYPSQGVTQDEIKSLVKQLTENNSHPVSVAMFKKLKSQTSICTIGKAESVPGSGIKSSWKHLTVLVGNPFWLRVQDHVDVAAALRRGNSVVCATIDGNLAGIFCLDASIRTEADSVVTKMNKQGIICHVVSGDNEVAVVKVAASVGIPLQNVRSKHSPLQKLAYVLDLIGNGKRVLFCGDGTNDAIAVAQANVGVQIGSASDVMLATADVVLSGGLEGIVQFLNVSKQSFRIIVFNFVWSFVYNFVAILSASGAFVNFRIAPAYAGIGEVVSVMPVIIAAMSLTFWRK